MTRLFVSCAAALLVTACANLPGVDEGVCGNAVLEAGEDCDGDSDVGTCAAVGEPNQCGFVCTEDGATVCPDGWGCGGDGRCRQPSGRFVEAPASPYRFPVTDFTIGDVDGDSLADLIGIEDDRVRIRFGDAASSFNAETSELVGQPVGPATFARFDEDNLLDVIVPTIRGIAVLLGGEDRALEPVPYTPRVENTPSLRAAAVDQAINGVSETLLVAENFDAISTLPGYQPDTTYVMFGEHEENFVEVGAQFGPGAQVPFEGLIFPLAVGNVDRNISPGDAREEFVLALEGAPIAVLMSSAGALDAIDDGQSGGVLGEIIEGDLRPERRARILLPQNTITIGRAFIADADGDGDQDVVIPYLGTEPAANLPCSAVDELYLGIAVGRNPGGPPGVSWGDTLPAVPIPALSRPPACDDGNLIPGTGEFPLAITDLSGDGKADYVTQDRILIADFGLGAPLTKLPDVGELTEVAAPGFSSTGFDSWSQAAIGDFNGDGRNDVAMSTQRFAFGDFEPFPVARLSIFLQAEGGLQNGFEVETENGIVPGVPHPIQPGEFRQGLLRAGDFDGDFVDDVVFMEDGGDESDRVMVVFGSASGGFAPPTSMGRLADVRQLEPILLADLDDNPDAISDLIVTRAVDSTQQTAIAFLRGSSSRRLLSPFILSDPDPEPELVIPQAIAVGRFDSSSPFRDLLVIGQELVFDVNAQGVTSGNVQGYTIPGLDGLGGLDETAVTIRNFDDSNFNPLCANWVVGELDAGATGEALDELVGVDGNGEACGLVELADGNGFDEQAEIHVVHRLGTGIDSETVSLDAELGWAPNRVQLVDMDSDGTLDVTVFLAGDPGSNEGKALFVGWNNGSASFADGAEFASIQFDASALTAAPIRLDSDALTDFVVLTTYGAFGYRALGSGQYEGPLSLSEAGISEDSTRLQVGDVNGDGLDDFAFLVGDEVRVFLAEAAESLGARGGELDPEPEPEQGDMQ